MTNEVKISIEILKKKKNLAKSTSLPSKPKEIEDKLQKSIPI